MLKLIAFWLVVALVACSIYVYGNYDKQKADAVTYQETYTCDHDARMAAETEQTQEIGSYTDALLKHCIKKLEVVKL